jgi:hypothetical protein
MVAEPGAKMRTLTLQSRRTNGRLYMSWTLVGKMPSATITFKAFLEKGEVEGFLTHAYQMHVCRNALLIEELVILLECYWPTGLPSKAQRNATAQTEGQPSFNID